MTTFELKTPRLKMVLYTPEQVLSWLDTLPADVRCEVSPAWVQRVRNTKPGDFWSLGFDIRLHDERPVGTCAFKGPPDADQVVELAYAIDPEHQRNGFATEAARALTKYAFATGQVAKVRAHTKPGNTASERVLTKCGFDRVGMVEEPEDGQVMRWEIAINQFET